MDAMQSRGVHDGVDAVDRPGQVVGAAEVALEQVVGGVDGPEVQQPWRMPGCGQGRDHHPGQVAASPGDQPLHLASLPAGRSTPQWQLGRAI
jgi:hypothetical protein